MPWDEELNADGICENLDAISEIERRARYLVFAQAITSPFDAEAIDRHATRHYRTRAGLSRDKRVNTLPDAARLLLSRDVPGERLVRGSVLFCARPTTQADIELARQLESRTSAGLAALAARCPICIFIASHDSDELCEKIASCIISGLQLGPILERDARRLYGPRTATLEFEAAVSVRDPS